MKISIKQASHFASILYGKQGIVTPLPGEMDFNFRITQTNGESFILKISQPGVDLGYLDYQNKLLLFLEKVNDKIPAPRIIMNNKGSHISDMTDGDGNIRKVRLYSWVSGRIWNDVNPQTPSLRRSLGTLCGNITQLLQDFDHEIAHREFVWDVAQSLWTREFNHLFCEEDKKLVIYFQELFEANLGNYGQLRKSVVHNDANENNIIVSSDLTDPKVMAVIDYGDTIHTQIVNDVAITCGYAVMGQEDPLEAALPVIQGYHLSFPLQEEELSHLYHAIAMRLIISVTKSAINKVDKPDNTYLQVSEKPAWEVLRKWLNVSSDFAHFSFRKACGYAAHPNESKFNNWITTNSFSLSDLFPAVARNAVHPVDLSVSSTWVGHESEFNDLDAFQFKIEQLQKQHPKKILAGGYLEPRALYTSNAYDRRSNVGNESRTIHLGIDCWLPAGTSVNALFDGEIFTAVNDKGNKEYGGLIILKHQFSDLIFYTLYGHLNPDLVLKNKIGDKISKGDLIGVLGNYPENGNWAPHLHFQIMLSMLDYRIDYPGVAYNSQLNIWKSLCPDPNLFFKCEELVLSEQKNANVLLSYRAKHLGKSLSLQYKQPIEIVRGSGAYLLDTDGRKYLDTVNNVAHVGHENIQVVKVGHNQMAVLNTNSRYLHNNINELTEELLETLPEELSVLHYVNSGSEANELAIRMARAATGSKDIIVSEVGYHGNTNMCVDISSYKFDAKGGSGAPETTHVIPLPDAFRGKYQGKNTGASYAGEVTAKINHIHNKGRSVCAFIIEPIISCGGQIELPEGFLKKAYSEVRKAGGICISDEVQVGCGRVGTSYWGFQLHNVIPDIVTIGKPLGNGHPIAAVACTPKVAEIFANGMEYFNTFGGNPVSCAIATEVLRVVKRDKLQENAAKVGGYLKEQLLLLSEKFPIIGQVRGKGLFLGIEFVDAEKQPLPIQTEYVIDRMKSFGILMSSDGPDHNVLKIKPPLIFSENNACELLRYLELVLNEDIMTTF